MLDNGAMLRVFADAGFETTRETVLGTAEVHLASRRRTRCARVSTSAITSASSRRSSRSSCPRRRGRSAHLLARARSAASCSATSCAREFLGVVLPGQPIGGVGRRCPRVPSVGAIGEPIDLAVICLPGPAVLDAAAEALAGKVRALCVISAGFAEIGAEGQARQDELVALVRKHGARLLGPNCLGIAASAPQLNATFGPRALPRGNVGFSSQSGALGLAVLERAAERRLGLSAFVSVGNKADISSNDLLEYWEDDPETDVVLLYLESFGNPRKFARVARRVARRKRSSR
jgi:acyl-CoA synthetase (NDP forming)